MFLSKPYSISLLLSGVALVAGCGDGEQSLNDDIVQGERSLPLGYTGYLNTRDLNQDGAMDLVVINVVGSTLGVRLGVGDGTFAELTRYPVGVTPTFLACDDFDEDGDLDVAVINAVSNDISVFLGDGDGALQQSGSFSVANILQGQLAAAPFGIVTGDFDNNGDVDIVTSNIGTNNVSSLLGRGDGTFKKARTYPLLGANSLGLAAFPLVATHTDGDGKLDLVVGGALSLTVMRGNGDGSFKAVSQIHTGVAVSCVEVADFDHDGRPDLATAAIGTSNYAILLGNGDGTYTLKESKPSGGIAGECFGIGDLDGDGELDLAIANSATLQVVGNVAVLLGNGDGTFGDPVGYPVGVTPWAASIVDFDGDGRRDVGVANGVNTSVSILLGNGDGTLQPHVMYSM